MNKVHGKTIFYPKNTFNSKLIIRNLFFAKNGQLLVLPSTRKKSYSFPICAVNFCKTFCTCSPSSLRQDLIIKNAKEQFLFFYIFSFGLPELKMVDLRCFLKEKNFVL
jgi:hypothetical protein